MGRGKLGRSLVACRVAAKGAPTRGASTGTCARMGLRFRFLDCCSCAGPGCVDSRRRGNDEWDGWQHELKGGNGDGAGRSWVTRTQFALPTVLLPTLLLA